MAAKRPAQDNTRKRKERQTASEVPPPAPQPPDRERRFVDVDPWAVLLEQLMEAPDEAERSEPKPSKRK